MKPNLVIESTRRRAGRRASEPASAMNWQDPTDPEAFEEIAGHLSDVRDSLRDLFRAVDSDPLRGRQSARELGLDRNLAWRISKFVGAEDLLAASPFVPTQKQVDRICEAVAKFGEPAELAERVQQALRRYDAFVFESAGTREHFDALVSTLVVADVSKLQENVRRNAFLANVAQWGVQAKVEFKTVVFSPHPSDEDQLEVMRLGGRVELTRSRQTVWPLHRAQWYSDDGSALEVKLEPICEASTRQDADIALIEEFCTKPIPSLIRADTAFESQTDLPGTGFGNAGAQTTVFGDLNRNGGSRWRGPNMDYHASMIDLYTPTELVVHDVFLHRDMKDFGQPEVMLLDRLSAAHGYNPSLDEHNRLPLSIRLVRISPRTGTASIAEYPEYSQLLRHAFSAVNWPIDEYVGYRFMMRYPTIPSASVVRFTVQEKPS